jgi:hypothetical protein
VAAAAAAAEEEENEEEEEEMCTGATGEDSTLPSTPRISGCCSHVCGREEEELLLRASVAVCV